MQRSDELDYPVYKQNDGDGQSRIDRLCRNRRNIWNRTNYTMWYFVSTRM